MRESVKKKNLIVWSLWESSAGFMSQLHGEQEL